MWIKKEELLRLKKDEYEKLLNLNDQALRWRIAEEIRSYVERMENSKDIICNNSEWTVWAKLKADWLDPLKDREDSLLDDSHRILFPESNKK